MKLLKSFILTSILLLFSSSCSSLAFKTNQPLIFDKPTFSNKLSNLILSYEIKCDNELYNCSEIEECFKRNIIEKNIFKKVMRFETTINSDYHCLIDYKTTFLLKPLSYTIAFFSLTIIPVPIKHRFEISFTIIQNKSVLKKFNYYRTGTAYFHLWSDLSNDKNKISKLNYNKMLDDIYNNFTFDFDHMLKNQ